MSVSSTANSLNSLVANSNAPNGSSGTSGSTDPATSIGNQFLTLLVTQLQNQDPSNPMDNSAMTTQLAQISTVTGINTLNTTMSSLAASLGSNQYMQAAGLVGHHVLLSGNQLQLANGTASGGLNLAAAADDVQVTVSDASGATVRTIDLGAQSAGVQTFTWDGKTDAGATAADGNYTFALQATQGGNTVTAPTALMAGSVTGIVLDSTGTTQVQLGALGNAPVSQIVEIN
jgi:flagellar basal-body rod modification protein FlgD